MNPEYERRFHELTAWARSEMAKLGSHGLDPENQIGQLWLIIDDLMRRLAKAETEKTLV